MPLPLMCHAITPAATHYHQCRATQLRARHHLQQLIIGTEVRHYPKLNLAVVRGEKQAAWTGDKG